MKVHTTCGVLSIVFIVSLISACSGRTAVKAIPTATDISTPTSTVIPTATPFTIPPDAYGAKTPGLLCDKGDGEWIGGANGIVFSCTSDGLKITDVKEDTTSSEMFFEWPGHPFSSNYRVHAKIQILDQSCAGVNVLIHGIQGYAGFICPGRTSWDVVKFAETGNPTLISYGTFSAPTDSQVVDMEVSNTSIVFRINDEIVTRISRDPSYTQTDDIGLIVQAPEGVDGSAIFSDFLYQPGA